MKIVRLIESFYPYMSGPANQAFMISNLLEQKGIFSPIFTTNYNAKKSPKIELFDNVHVKRYEESKKFMRYIITKNLKKDIIKENPDIIHGHNFRNYQVAIGYRVAKKLNIPFVFNSHGSIAAYKTITKGVSQLPYKFYDLIEGNKIIKNANAIIVSSSQEKEEAILFGVNEKKIHIIPMGINIEDYDAIKKDVQDNKIRILFVGRICRDRNLLPILKALNELKNSPCYSSIELRIVGNVVKRTTTEKSGYIEEIKDYINENNLNVELIGAKYKNDLKKEYKNADIFIYTSIWENFGQTILEAAAAGLPVISTRVGVALDLVKNDQTGYFVPFNNSEEISKSIKKLLKKEKREIFGRNIKKIVEKNYSWEKTIKKYENLYDNLLNKKKS